MLREKIAKDVKVMALHKMALARTEQGYTELPSAGQINALSLMGPDDYNTAWSLADNKLHLENMRKSKGPYSLPNDVDRRLSEVNANDIDRRLAAINQKYDQANQERMLSERDFDRQMADIDSEGAARYNAMQEAPSLAAAGNDTGAMATIRELLSNAGSTVSENPMASGAAVGAGGLGIVGLAKLLARLKGKNAGPSPI